MRHKSARWALLAGFALIFQPVSPAASAEDVEVTTGADLATAYVWRGVTFNEDPVVQPYVDIAHKSGLGFNAWSNFDLGDYGGSLKQDEFSEVDLTVSYAFPIEQFNLGASLIFYLFPQAGSGTNTEEINLSGGYDLTEVWSAGADLYYDFGVVDGIYANIGSSLDLGAILKAPEKTGLELSVGFGFADNEFAEAYSGTEGGAFDFNAGLSGSLEADPVVLSAFLSYSNNLDSDVLPDQDTELYGGVGISGSF